MRFLIAALLLPAVLLPTVTQAQDATRIGTIDTTFRLLGRNDRILVERYDDPRVPGVSCYVTRAETGGISGSLGIASNPSRFSIACRATTKVTANPALPDKEEVFSASASLLFKEVRVTRMFDRDKRVLVYVVWSTQALSRDGSPFNSVTAVPLDAP